MALSLASPESDSPLSQTLYSTSSEKQKYSHGRRWYHTLHGSLVPSEFSPRSLPKLQGAAGSGSLLTSPAPAVSEARGQNRCITEGSVAEAAPRRVMGYVGPYRNQNTHVCVEEAGEAKVHEGELWLQRAHQARVTEHHYKNW